MDIDGRLCSFRTVDIQTLDLGWTIADPPRRAEACADQRVVAGVTFRDLSVNGKQTIDENIADLAGLSAAYDGYNASLARKTAPTQDGFSGDQRFFIAFGQNWGSKARESALRQQLMTDPHSPAESRNAPFDDVQKPCVEESINEWM
jgi:predicted metalloendopeptidase